MFGCWGRAAGAAIVPALCAALLLLQLGASARAQEPAAAAAPAEAENFDDPVRVTIGAYVNDIQAIDLRTHSYVIDLYVWMRWKAEGFHAGKNFEFMNTFDPEAHVQADIYGEPDLQPDGSYYVLYRRQGAFSNKFPLGQYPFDKQLLKVDMEDADLSVDQLRYVSEGVTMNPRIRLPGYLITDVRLQIEDYPYPTSFGHLADPDPGAYSRASLQIAIERPWVSGVVKTFLPVLLIVFCAAAALLLSDAHTQSRIGLAITALLALVALQFSTSTSLPEVGYLLMIEQIYILSYAFILLVIWMTIRGAWRAETARPGDAPGTALGAMLTSVGFMTLYIAALAGVVAWNLLTPPA